LKEEEELMASMGHDSPNPEDVTERARMRLREVMQEAEAEVRATNDADLNRRMNRAADDFDRLAASPSPTRQRPDGDKTPPASPTTRYQATTPPRVDTRMKTEAQKEEERVAGIRRASQRPEFVGSPTSSPNLKPQNGRPMTPGAGGGVGPGTPGSKLEYEEMMRQAMHEAQRRVNDAAATGQRHTSPEKKTPGSEKSRAQKIEEERAKRARAAKEESKKREARLNQAAALDVDARRKANIKRVASELNSKTREEAVYNAMKDEVDRKVKEQRDRQRSKEKTDAKARAKHEEELKSKRDAEWARLQADRKRKAHDEQKRRAAEQAKKNQQQARSKAKASTPGPSNRPSGGKSPNRPRPGHEKSDQWDNFFDAWDQKSPPGEKGPRAKSRSTTAPRVSATERLSSRASSDDARWETFEASSNASIELKQIPFPQVTTRYFGPGCDKKSFQKLAMRWHPDKFLQKFGTRLCDKDKDNILLKVKEVFQAINSCRK